MRPVVAAGPSVARTRQLGTDQNDAFIDVDERRSLLDQDDDVDGDLGQLDDEPRTLVARRKLSAIGTSIRDNADFLDPKRHPTGIEHVLVNGLPAGSSGAGSFPRYV